MPYRGSQKVNEGLKLVWLHMGLLIGSNIAHWYDFCHIKNVKFALHPEMSDKQNPMLKGGILHSQNKYRPIIGLATYIWVIYLGLMQCPKMILVPKKSLKTVPLHKYSNSRGYALQGVPKSQRRSKIGLSGYLMPYKSAL